MRQRRVERPLCLAVLLNGLPCVLVNVVCNIKVYCEYLKFTLCSISFPKKTSYRLDILATTVVARGYVPPSIHSY